VLWFDCYPPCICLLVSLDDSALMDCRQWPILNCAVAVVGSAPLSAFLVSANYLVSVDFGSCCCFGRYCCDIHCSVAWPDFASRPCSFAHCRKCPGCTTEELVALVEVKMRQQQQLAAGTVADHEIRCGRVVAAGCSSRSCGDGSRRSTSAVGMAVAATAGMIEADSDAPMAFRRLDLDSR